MFELHGAIRTTKDRHCSILRQSKLIPGVLQGKSLPPVPLVVPRSEIQSFMDQLSPLALHFGLFHLEMHGKKQLVQAVGYQSHHISQIPLSIIFHRITAHPLPSEEYDRRVKSIVDEELKVEADRIKETLEQRRQKQKSQSQPSQQ